MGTKDVKYRISLEDKFNKTLDKSEKKVNSFEGKILKAGKAITGVLAGAAVIGAVTRLGSAVIETTAEFEKFEAVLTNTLGSKSEAQKALKDITKFASETPFQVNELTGSFVKLANQGFKPSLKEMTSLGDLAASTGKSFDQLTEAIIDAQVGEFERLKEFGIRASKQGDKVKFTFKGVKKQVDFTEKSIQSYILSLGKAQGVSGAMAAISKTVGGQISNLKDSVDQAKLALGKRFNPAIKNSISLTSKLVRGITEWVKVPLSDTIRKTRIELNSEFNVLRDGNITTDQRLKLITQINTKYKDYLPNLLTEKSSIDDIRIAQDAANTALLKKIEIQAKSEILEAQISKVAKLRQKQFESTLSAEKHLEELKEETDASDLKRLRIKERAEADQIRSNKFRRKAAKEERELARLQLSLGSFALGIDSSGGKKGIDEIAKELEKTGISKIISSAPKVLNITIQQMTGIETLNTNTFEQGSEAAGNNVLEQLQIAITDAQAVS